MATNDSEKPKETQPREDSPSERKLDLTYRVLKGDKADDVRRKMDEMESAIRTAIESSSLPYEKKQALLSQLSQIIDGLRTSPAGFNGLLQLQNFVTVAYGQVAEAQGFAGTTQRALQAAAYAERELQNYPEFSPQERDKLFTKIVMRAEYVNVDNDKDLERFVGAPYAKDPDVTPEGVQAIVEDSKPMYRSAEGRSAMARYNALTPEQKAQIEIEDAKVEKGLKGFTASDPAKSKRVQVWRGLPVESNEEFQKAFAELQEAKKNYGENSPQYDAAFAKADAAAENIKKRRDKASDEQQDAACVAGKKTSSQVIADKIEASGDCPAADTKPANSRERWDGMTDDRRKAAKKNFNAVMADENKFNKLSNEEKLDMLAYATVEAPSQYVKMMDQASRADRRAKGLNQTPEYLSIGLKVGVQNRGAVDNAKVGIIARSQQNDPFFQTAKNEQPELYEAGLYASVSGWLGRKYYWAKSFIWSDDEENPAAAKSEPEKTQSPTPTAEPKKVADDKILQSLKDNGWERFEKQFGNGDGKLTMEEIRKSLKDNNVTVRDMDKDGDIDAKDYSTMMQQVLNDKAAAAKKSGGGGRGQG